MSGDYRRGTDGGTEIIRAVLRRRRWSIEEKVRLPDATMQRGASDASVADRHRVSRSLLFYWRKQAKAGLMPGVMPLASPEAPIFAPVIIAAEAPSMPKQSSRPLRKMAAQAGFLVEVALGNGRMLKADEGIAPDRLAALVAALDR